MDGVSLNIPDNIILGIAGESGCGKTTLMKVIYGDISSPLALSAGSIEYDLQRAKKSRVTSENIRKYWFRRISYIPQSSMSSLNPVVRIREQFLDFQDRSQSRAKVLEQATDLCEAARAACRVDRCIPTPALRWDAPAYDGSHGDLFPTESHSQPTSRRRH